MGQVSGHFSEEISVQEAAKKYGLTPSQITKLARGKRIRGRKFGRDWILDEASLRNYVVQPRKTGPKPRTPLSSAEITHQGQGPSSSQSECKPLDPTDWLQQTIDDLNRAVEAGQLSEEGRKVIIAQLAREQQIQELVRRAAQDPERKAR